LFSETDCEESNFLHEYIPETWDNAPYEPLKGSPQWREYTLEYLDLKSSHQRIINEDDYCDRVAEWQAANPIRLGDDNMPVKDDRVSISDYQNETL
jgi:hypothetical protein